MFYKKGTHRKKGGKRRAVVSLKPVIFFIIIASFSLSEKGEASQWVKKFVVTAHLDRMLPPTYRSDDAKKKMEFGENFGLRLDQKVGDDILRPVGVVRLEIPREQKQFRSGQVGFNSPMGVVSSEIKPYSGEKSKAVMKDMPVYALRYPGGTIGNFFDWDGLTICRKTVERLQPSGMKATVLGHLSNMPSERNFLPLDDYFKILRQRSAEPFIVLNVYTETAEKMKNAVKKVKAFSKQSIHWELGNELSSENYVQIELKGKWNVGQYVKKVLAIGQYIKAVSTQDKIGVVGHDLGVERVPKKSLEKGNSDAWNIGIKGLKHVDAIVYHPYILTNDMVKKRLWQFYKNEKSLLPGFESAIDEMTWRWVFGCVQEVPRAYVKKHEELFGGKGMWLTEVGLLEGRDNRGAGVGDSRRFLRTIFGVSYFVSWMRYVEKVETILFHSLKAGNGATAVRFGDMSLTANGLAYAFIEASTRNAECLSVVNMPLRHSYHGVAQYSTVEINALSGLFTVSKKGQRRMLIVNSGPDTIDIGIPFPFSEVYMVGGRPNVLVQPGQYKNIENLRSIDFGKDSLMMRPFSVAVVFEKMEDREVMKK